MKTTFIVAADGSGDFTQVQAAIEAIPAQRSAPVTIQIKRGVYKEKILLEKPQVRLIGEGAAQTIITYDDAALKLLPDGTPMGTFNSYSVFIGADDVSAEGLTFANTAGSGDVVGQAVAAYVDGDRTAFYDCRFLGRQDTLFTGPLPPTPKDPKAPFKGPRATAPRRPTRQYYRNCYIEGDVDFIFGSATVVFDGCDIVSYDRKREMNGYITAASTPEGQEFGYVFLDCRLCSEAAPQTVYLGRPWRDYARVAFLKCWMGAHIKAEGWHNWDKKHAEQLVRYVEYQNEGPGAQIAARVPWVKILTDDEAQHYTVAQVLAGTDGWLPQR